MLLYVLRETPKLSCRKTAAIWMSTSSHESACFPVGSPTVLSNFWPRGSHKFSYNALSVPCARLSAVHLLILIESSQQPNDGSGINIILQMRKQV